MWGLRLPLQPQAASKLEKVVLSCLIESKHRRDPMLFVLGCYISVFLWVPRCMPHDPQIFGVVGGIGAVDGVDKTIPPHYMFQQFYYFVAEAKTCIGASWRKQGTRDAQVDL